MASLKEEALKAIINDQVNDKVLDYVVNNNVPEPTITKEVREAIIREAKLEEAMDMIAKLDSDDTYDNVMLEIEEKRNKWKAGVERAAKAREGKQSKK